MLNGIRWQLHGNICGARWHCTPIDVQLHEWYVHSNRRPYDCPYCGMLFKTNAELKHHVRIHTGAKPYSCSHCSERFTSLVQLKTHLLKSHNEGTWLECNICQKKFSDSGHLKEHLLRHAAVKPYACSDCPQQFCTSSELRRHQLVHSDYRQFCCGLNFQQTVCNNSHHTLDMLIHYLVKYNNSKLTQITHKIQ